MNVQCAGGGAWIGEKTPRGRRWAMKVSTEFRGKRTDPCGWKGRRKNTATLYGPDGMYPEATADPCPQCHGRVELIPQANAAR